MADECVEGGLPLVPFPDTDQVVGIPQTQFSEHLGPLEEFEGRGD